MRLIARMPLYTAGTLALAAMSMLLGVSGTARAASGHPQPVNVADGRPLCGMAGRVSIEGLQLAKGGFCLLTRPDAMVSRKKHRRVVRTGKIIDTDTTYGDNVFQVASGKAFCKHNEQVVTGGLRIVKLSGLFGGPSRTSGGESAPILKRPAGWSVAFGSDLGGLARTDFRVVVCERT